MAVRRAPHRTTCTHAPESLTHPSLNVPAVSAVVATTAGWAVVGATVDGSSPASVEGAGAVVATGTVVGGAAGTDFSSKGDEAAESKAALTMIRSLAEYFGWQDVRVRIGVGAVGQHARLGRADDAGARHLVDVAAGDRW